MREELKEIYEILEEICKIMLSLKIGTYEKDQIIKLISIIEEKIKALS